MQYSEPVSENTERTTCTVVAIPEATPVAAVSEQYVNAHDKLYQAATLAAALLLLAGAAAA